MGSYFMGSGVRGMKSFQTALDVEANNLANIGTNGFLRSSTEFSDTMAQLRSPASAPTKNYGGSNPIQIGTGVQVSSTTISTIDGGKVNTGNTYDLATDGVETYFVLSNGNEVTYTLDGGFDLDAANNLVHRASSMKVLGWPADSTGAINTNAQILNTSYINIPINVLTAAEVTTSASITGNLNSSAGPTESASFSSIAFDALGTPYTVTYSLLGRQSPVTTTGAPVGSTSSWEWTAYVGNQQVGGSIVQTGQTLTTVGPKVFFDAAGNFLPTVLPTPTNPHPPSPYSITVPTGTNTQAFDISVDLSKIQQLSTTSKLIAKSDDGFAPGTLKHVSINGDGTIAATFSTGLIKNIGQIATASFVNVPGLQKIGNNLWSATANSGDPAIGVAGTDNRELINSGYLKQSNVDMASSMVNIIVYEKNFAANAKVVQTADQVLDVAVHLKR